MPTAKTAEPLGTHPDLHCLPQDIQPLPGTRSMRGAFCFRRRRLCLLIRREALLCSVELLNLQAKARVSSSAAIVVALAAREPGNRGLQGQRGERAHGGQTMGNLLGKPEAGVSPGLLCPAKASLCSGSQGEISVSPRPKFSYLLVESSSSESKKLVVSSSLLMSVEELSYPPRSRRRSPFTVPFTLGAVKRQGSVGLRQTLPLCRTHNSLLRTNLAISQCHLVPNNSQLTLGSDPSPMGYLFYHYMMGKRLMGQ